MAVTELGQLGGGIAIGCGAIGAGLGIGFATKGLMDARKFRLGNRSSKFERKNLKFLMSESSRI